ncbi:TPR-like protein [Mytilinidion resinicola]|uniref:TPR-like protein n=1 Tax=Mytilinidion resinicola TaxID=574789 RepID=A0A6A6Z3L7_9PEZI|nr:TPR-like protein [Mytilinidion resinicola]KAF2814874.1 TPR-like protein [Mytilinidion resinicola]
MAFAIFHIINNSKDHQGGMNEMSSKTQDPLVPDPSTSFIHLQKHLYPKFISARLHARLPTKKEADQAISRRIKHRTPVMDRGYGRYSWPNGNPDEEPLPPAQYLDPYSTEQPFSGQPQTPFNHSASPFLPGGPFGPSGQPFQSPYQNGNGYGHQVPGSEYSHQVPAINTDHNPFISSNLAAPQTASYQTEADFATGGLVIHDGFIPTNFEESDDEEASYPVLPDAVRTNLQGYQTYVNSFESGILYDRSDEDSESESEEDPAVEEAFVNDIRDANDPEVDPDFSASDAEELNSGDELLAPESPRRGRGRGNARWRGSVRGKGSARGRGRGRGGGRGRARGRSILDRRPPARETRSGNVRRGARKAADPGQQYKRLQIKANESYINRDFKTAAEYAMTAIQLNPEIFATHSLLSEIYLDMGDEQRSIEALIVGAPTKRDKHLWFHVLQRVWDLDEKKYPMYTRNTKIGVAISCLREILIIDPRDYEARHEKLKIELELGNVAKAVSLCRLMLEIKPHETDILREMARICTKDAKGQRYLDTASKSFENSINHFITNEEFSNSSFDWSLLNYYLEIVEKQKEHKKAVAQAKRLSRWLLGRKDEVFWDELDDDREWDIALELRRTDVAGFELGKYPLGTYGAGLPMEVRVKMGTNRLRMSGLDNYEEAMRHLELLEPDVKGTDAKVMDYGDLFREAAEALKAEEHFEQAIRFYKTLKTNPDEMTVPCYINLIRSYNALGRSDEAAEDMETLIKFDCKKVEELALLAKFLEASGKAYEAIQRGRQAYNMGGHSLLKRLQFKHIAAVLPDWMPKTPMGRGPYQKRLYSSVVGKAPEAKKAATSSKKSQAEKTVRQGKRLMLRTLAPRPVIGVDAVPGEDAITSEGEDVMDVDEALTDEDGGATEVPAQPLETLKPKKISMQHPRIVGPITYMPYLMAFNGEAEDEELLTPLTSIRKRIRDAERQRPDEFHYQKGLDRKMRVNFALLRELGEDATKGDRVAAEKCLDAGEEMVTEFLGFEMFSCDRNEPFRGYFRKKGLEWREAILSRLACFSNRVDDGEQDIDPRADDSCNDFHGITFEDWGGVLIQYSLLLAKAGDSGACFATLSGASRSCIFWHRKDLLYRIHTCWLACAIECDSSQEVVNAVRWFMKNFPYSSDIYRIYSLANRLLGEGSFYSTAVNQKSILRHIKLSDYQQMTDEQRDWFKYNDTARANYLGKAVREGLLQHVRGHDPVLFALFGHTLADGATYTAALNYYFRAYTICPDDPVLNLCIGLCYVQHAMKRQSENRQFQVQQGMAFVFRYYELRTKDDVAVLLQEAEFNMGRVWHLLGLNQLAMPCYRKCIELGPKVREEHERGEHSDVGAEDFSVEAAFAIQTILALAGDFEGARRVTEEALVIE